VSEDPVLKAQSEELAALLEGTRRFIWLAGSALGVAFITLVVPNFRHAGELRSERAAVVAEWARSQREIERATAANEVAARRWAAQRAPAEVAARQARVNGERRPLTAPPEEPAGVLATRQDRVARLRALDESYAARLAAFGRTQDDLSFLSLGGRDIAIPSSLVGALWGASAAGVLLLFDRRRRNILGLMSRILRRAPEGERPYLLAGAAVNGSWWLAPLPSADGAKVSAAALRSALGWQRHLRREALPPLVVGGLVLGLLSVGQRASLAILPFASLDVVDLHVDLHGPVVQLAHAGAAMLVVFSLLRWWTGPAVVPDTLPVEPTASEGRRDLLAVFVSGALGGLAWLLVRRSPNVQAADGAGASDPPVSLVLPPPRGAPRRPDRHNDLVVSLAPGLYRRAGEGPAVIHAVLERLSPKGAVERVLLEASGGPRGAGALRVDRLRPLTEAELGELVEGWAPPSQEGSHLRLARAGAFCEAEIARRVGTTLAAGLDLRTLVDEVELLLRIGIVHDRALKREHPTSPPSVRLHDLYAGLAVISGRLDRLDGLISHIRQPRGERYPYADWFTARIARWRDPGSGWRRRWQGRRMEDLARALVV
jgi:hypothetical protein